MNGPQVGELFRKKIRFIIKLPSLFSSMMVAFSGYQTSPSQPLVVRRTRYNHGLGLAL
jgi:hypothetical protein